MVCGRVMCTRVSLECQSGCLGAGSLGDCLRSLYIFLYCLNFQFQYDISVIIKNNKSNLI